MFILDKAGLTYLWSKIKSAFVSSIGVDGNDLTYTKNGTTSNITVPYATKAGKLSVTSTDNAVVRFDGTSGSVQNSGVTINDSNHVTAAKFITNGGTNSQFVKGDGSLDNKKYFGVGDVIQSTNPFSALPNRLYISKIDNAFYAATQRFVVTGEFIDGESVTSVTSSNLARLFDGDYETKLEIDGGESGQKKLVVHMRFDGVNVSSVFPGYPYGYIYISFYDVWCPSSISVRVYCNYASQGIGWKELTVTNKSLSASKILYEIYNGYYAIQEFEFTIVSDTENRATKTGVTQIEMWLDRPSPSRNPFVSKYAPEVLLYPITAPNFITPNGSANQFLKANGTLDSTSYAPTASPALTGTPTAPTAAASTNSTQIATTAFVKTAISDKQDTIDDLATIRSGASAGATALQPNDIPSWAKQSSKPTYTAQEVGALPASTSIPSKTSDLTNDSGFLTTLPITLDIGTHTYNNH